MVVRYPPRDSPHPGEASHISIWACVPCLRYPDTLTPWAVCEVSLCPVSGFSSYPATTPLSPRQGSTVENDILHK